MLRLGWLHLLQSIQPCPDKNAAHRTPRKERPAKNAPLRTRDLRRDLWRDLRRGLWRGRQLPAQYVGQARPLCVRSGDCRPGNLLV